MTRLPDILLILLLVALTGLMPVGCGDDPAGPTYRNTTTLKVHVADEKGNPYPSCFVHLFPGSNKKRTGSDGVAVFDPVDPGTYQVMIDDTRLPLYYKNFTVQRARQNEMNFTIVDKVTVNVFLHDEDGVPITGVELNTSPWTQAINADDEGSAVLERIPITKYRFIVKRGEYIYTSEPYTFVIRDGVVEDVIIVVPSLLPQIEIETPLPNSTLDGLKPQTFKGDGWDFEDGSLPEEVFTWASSIDGDLGVGREITIDRLSVGYHHITFTATDSHGGSSTRDILIGVTNYAVDSWFPLAYRASWTYRYLTPVFTIENEEGMTELWYLSDLLVDMGTTDSRQSHLGYYVTFIKNDMVCYTRLYTHIVTDYFQSSGDGLYITKSEEEIHLEQNTVSTGRTQTKHFYLTTEYMEPYEFLRNPESLVQGDSFDQTMTTMVTWIESDDDDAANFREELTTSASCAIGSMETVSTDMGSYETIPVTLKMEGSTRQWWLASGIGIVRLSYDLNGYPLTAVLSESTIDEIRDEYVNGAAKMHSVSAPTVTGPVIDSPFSSAPDSPHRLFEETRFIRRIMP